ncbi:MAG TPA: hypothetical protein VHY22_13060 [Chthoniobacteraceae bacterium]|jgi:hypothetical protein|nr:hypothetical protein [Chthoniobacteraceae bacterium]
MPGAKKIRRLVAPDFSALDTIWRNPLPFVLWPVGPQPLVGHWMDDAVRNGIDEVEVYVADRPAAVRLALEGGVYWSRPVKVIPIANESGAPADAERMDRLPGMPADLFGGDARALLERWFALQKGWLQSRGDEPVAIDSRHQSGGWIGPHASVHPRAVLRAPFWIGGSAKIGEGCQVGPNAIIGENSILGQNVEIEEGCVLPNTYLGHNTRLSRSLADGNAVVDWGRGCRVDIRERFILRPVVPQVRGVGLLQRAAAFVSYCLLAPFASLCNRMGWTSREVRTPGGDAVRLRTGLAGPLWARRWPWLLQIALGRFGWIGILPRREEDWESVPEEVLHQLRSSRFGMFSLADLHGCHDPADPEESIHAIYQALQADSRSRILVARNLWRIAWSR